MVVTGGTKLANIDFGWLEERPMLDTGTFPIPDGLQYEPPFLSLHLDRLHTDAAFS